MYLRSVPSEVIRVEYKAIIATLICKQTTWYMYLRSVPREVIRVEYKTIIATFICKQTTNTGNIYMYSYKYFTQYIEQGT